MHVALLAPEFLPNWGGIGTYCVELVKALPQQVELDVITLERRIPGQPAMTEREMEARFDREIRVHSIARATDTFLYNAGFQLAVRRYLAKVGRKEGIDIVHSQHAHMSHLLYGLSRDRLPILTTVHTTIRGQRYGIVQSRTAFGHLESSEKWQVALQPALRLAEWISLGSSERFVTMSRWMREAIHRELPTLQVPVDVVPNGVDTSRYTPESANEFDLLDGYEGPVVLITSRPTAAKGVQYAIGAMQTILANHPEIRFVFAGGGDLATWQRSLAAFGIPLNACTFLGYVPYDKLPAMYARATIYLLPSLYENVPLRLLEAMSCGTAVVATTVNGIPEVVTHAQDGLLVPPANPVAIAEAVLMLLDDPDLAHKLGQSARKLMTERFDWKVVAERTLRSYRLLLGG